MTPESQGFMSFRDLGIIYGEGVFDTARTFGGRMFRLADHIDRLYDSLAYGRIDPGMTKAGMTAVTEEVLAANLPVLRPGEDYWVTQRVTAGIRALDGEPQSETGATVMIECAPLPLRARARYFRDGIDAVTAKRPKIAPDALSPRAKTTNYLNMMLAQAEVADIVPGGWAIQPDHRGNLAEGPGNNVFFVKDGKVHTPSDDLCAGRCQPSGRDRDLRRAPDSAGDRRRDPAMAAAADEAFFTSTSLCACPVRSLDGRVLPGGAPGPVTRRIMEAFADGGGVRLCRRSIWPSCRMRLRRAESSAPSASCPMPPAATAARRPDASAGRRRAVERIHAAHAQPAQRFGFPAAHVAVDPGQAGQVGVAAQCQVGQRPPGEVRGRDADADIAARPSRCRVCGSKPDGRAPVARHAEDAAPGVVDLGTSRAAGKCRCRIAVSRRIVSGSGASVACRWPIRTGRARRARRR